ncbi:MAG: hypothetical protein ACI87H_003406, partial [Gammaproteobacteria bacterium]
PGVGDLDTAQHQPAETDCDRAEHHQQHRVAVAAVDFMRLGWSGRGRHWRCLGVMVREDYVKSAFCPAKYACTNADHQRFAIAIALGIVSTIQGLTLISRGVGSG